MLAEEEIRKISNIFGAIGNLIRFKIVMLVNESERPLHIKAVANYYLLPFFYGKYETTPEVAAALLAPIAVFNTTQALINIIPTYAIYKRVAGKICPTNREHKSY